MAEGISDIRLASDPSFRDERKPRDRQAGLRRSAIIAAALAHAALIGGIAVHWPALFPVVPPPKSAIPVTLVILPPPPPPAPKVQPAPPPPPPPADLQHERVSGPDTETTAPPKQADKGADAAPEATAPPPPVETHANTAALAPPVEKPKPKPAPEIHPPKPKLALRETAPRPDHGLANRAPGATERSGDPYLNRLYDLIDAHRTYPANAIGSLGMKLAGTVVYLIGVRSDGALIGTKLQRSSGAEILDQTALSMIEAAAPFPPLPPSEFSGPDVVIQVTIYIAPTGG